MNPSAQFEFTERSVVEAVRWLRLVIETTGAAIIALGLVIALAAFVRVLARSSRRWSDPGRAVEGYNVVRLTLARYLALALEFQLGADILSTAIAPTWDQIGKLGAIAVIRTALSYFWPGGWRSRPAVSSSASGTAASPRPEPRPRRSGAWTARRSGGRPAQPPQPRRSAERSSTPLDPSRCDPSPAFSSRHPVDST